MFIVIVLGVNGLLDWIFFYIQFQKHTEFKKYLNVFALHKISNQVAFAKKWNQQTLLFFLF